MYHVTKIDMINVYSRSVCLRKNIGIVGIPNCFGTKTDVVLKIWQPYIQASMRETFGQSSAHNIFTLGNGLQCYKSEVRDQYNDNLIVSYRLPIHFVITVMAWSAS